MVCQFSLLKKSAISGIKINCTISILRFGFMAYEQL